MTELEVIRNQLWAEVADLSDPELNTKPNPDTWSIAQVLEHLYLVERGIASQLIHGLYEESETAIEQKPLYLTLDRTRKVKVPTSALEPKEEEQSLASLKEKLDKSRQQLIDQVNQLDSHTLDHRALPHPAFGLLSFKQWIEFVGVHGQRHLDQIKDIKEQLHYSKQT